MGPGEHARVHGSTARGGEHAHSDVDSMTVGDRDFADLVLALAPAQGRLRRGIHATVLSHEAWTRKLKQRDGFIAQVWQGPNPRRVGEKAGGSHEP